MSFTGTDSSLQKRAEEAVRYAIDYQLGYSGTVKTSVTAATTLNINTDDIESIAVGDVVIFGSYSRTVISVTVVYQAPLLPYLTITFAGAVTVTAGTAIRVDYSNNVRRSDDMRSRELIPWLCFVQVINLKQDDPGSTYYTGTLVVSLHSLFNTTTAEDGSAVTDASLIADLEPHEAKVTIITGILSDPVTLWDLVKPGAVNRPVSDLGIVAILNDDQPGSVSTDGLHNFEIRKTIRLINSD